MVSLIRFITFFAFVLIFLQKVRSDEQPVSMSHQSYFRFDAEDIFNLGAETRNKRRATAIAKATAVAFSSIQAQEIVDIHNRFRASVRPQASNMEYMKWDTDLARMAMRYSQRCHWGHGSVINVSPHSSVGQNLWVQGLSNRNTVPLASSAVNAWHREIRNYNFDTHECTSPHQCGHYTQLVWAETTSVGCGLAFCPRTTNWTHADSWIMTCYYGPAGNYIGVRPYTKGPSCTQCKSEVGQCYNNMCRLCSEHNEVCDCRQQCVNCGTVDPFSCTCICQDGWYGPDCGRSCNETHPYCGANPGWPGPSFCGQHPMIPKHCPKMCGLCVDPDPTFTCGTSGPQPTAVNPAAGPGATKNPPLPPGNNPPARTQAPVNPPLPTQSRIPATKPPMKPPVKPPVKPPFNPVPPIFPTYPPRRPTIPPARPTVPYIPGAGPTAVDCKIPCRNGGAQNLVTCMCTCTRQFTGQYCQHDWNQINNGAMLRLVGDIRNWGMMEYDMHQAIEQSVDMYCNSHVTMCCPKIHSAPPTAQLNYLDMTDVITGTGFPEVDEFRSDSYWILLAATEPAAPQLCSEGANGGAGVSPALLLSRKREKRDSSGESEEDGGLGPAPIYVDKAILLSSVDQNMAAIQSVLTMYDVKLAEVQRGKLLKGNAANAMLSSPHIVVLSLIMLFLTAVFV